MLSDRLFLRRLNTYIYLFTPGKGTHDRPNMDTIQVHIGEPVSFIGLTYRTEGEGLEDQKSPRDNCIPKTHSTWVTAHKNWEPGATAQPAGCSVC